MTETVECAVIGAGVVGLAIARALALAGREVVILEAERAHGMHTSSRNTGCIHAGIAYPPGSLKARLALRGKALLYEYCAAHGVGHRRVGKLIVATDEGRMGRLHALKATAEANGLDDMRMLDAAEAREMEPELSFAGVLHSPSSGIVDADELMRAYLGDAEDHGAMLALNAPVEGGRVTGDGIVLSVGGGERTELLCRICVNAAGLGAERVARAIEGVPPDTVPRIVMARGCYFVLTSRRPFSRLIYPLPGDHDQVVHVSPDMAGQIRFGPDTEFVTDIDYTVDPGRAGFFYDAAQRFWPGIADGDLSPGYAGIRPKLSRERATDIDFMIQDRATHGIDGLIALYGLESPGLTSSLAIGEYVAGLAAT